MLATLSIFTKNSPRYSKLRRSNQRTTLRLLSFGFALCRNKHSVRSEHSIALCLDPALGSKWKTFSDTDKFQLKWKLQPLPLSQHQIELERKLERYNTDKYQEIEMNRTPSQASFRRLQKRSFGQPQLSWWNGIHNTAQNRVWSYFEGLTFRSENCTGGDF